MTENHSCWGYYDYISVVLSTKMFQNHSKTIKNQFFGGNTPRYGLRHIRGAPEVDTIDIRGVAAISPSFLSPK